MTSELEAAIHAARAAGKLLCQRFGAAREIRYKGPTDPVTEMDHQAQDLVTKMLGEAFPAYSLLGEEGGRGCAPDGPCWLVDPLDGTTNYIRGYPLFAVSIALERGDDIVVGVVYNPVLDELFAAEEGQGATLNGHPIHVSSTSSLEASVLASGFPYDAGAVENNNSRHWGRFLKRTLSLRCDGSAALDLCHVAMGRLDGFWELDLGPWDMAAGVLIVREAGGCVTHVNGGRFSPYERGILASNSHLHAEMLSLLTVD
jgi:myo-inositol-1(or 4)-monophosphatase